MKILMNALVLSLGIAYTALAQEAGPLDQDVYDPCPTYESCTMDPTRTGTGSGTGGDGSTTTTPFSCIEVEGEDKCKKCTRESQCTFDKAVDECRKKWWGVVLCIEGERTAKALRDANCIENIC